jgi:pentatricopeptide repeat protein
MWEEQGDAERAWKSIEKANIQDAEVFYMFRAYYALLTRDPENIRLSLDNWPEQYRSPAHAPELYNISRAEALLAFGETDAAQALFQEIKARIDASAIPYPDAWRANALYYPVELPGYVGDLDEVREVIARFEATQRPDAWAEIDYLVDCARALARAGDFEAAFDYIDRMISVRGPYIYLRTSIDPAFDKLRKHPRYVTLRTNFEAWAASQNQKL